MPAAASGTRWCRWPRWCGRAPTAPRPLRPSGAPRAARSPEPSERRSGVRPSRRAPRADGGVSAGWGPGGASPGRALRSDRRSLPSGLGRLCRAYRHLDRCEHRIAPREAKYGLRNGGARTLFHCNCTRRCVPWGGPSVRPSSLSAGLEGGRGVGRDAERCPAVPAEWCGPCAGRGAPEAWSRRSWRSASPRAASCWNRSPSAERSAGAGECGGNGAGPGPAVLGSPQRSLFCSSSGCVTEARAVLIRARHLRTTLRRRGAERREWDAQESGGDALYERCRRVALEQGMGAPQHPAPR